MIRGLVILLAGLIAITMAPSADVQAANPPEQASSAAPGPPSHRAVLDRYCVTCHNARLRTAGLALDTTDLGRVGEFAASWEKVVRKLRTGTMPPVGRQRPDPAASEALTSWLETALDQAAAAAPNPGPRPAFHRLSRTEYKHAIRDLLALEHLPREMDVSLLLPADSATSGFDNVAEILRVSPTLLERYLAAAQKISRLAVGDPEIPIIVDTYRFPQELPQDVHVDGLPVGTRGGTLFRNHVPLDGKYVVTIELAGRPRERHRIEVSVDGQRVELLTVGEEGAKPQQNLPSGERAGGDLQVSLALKAGPRTIGVAFVQRTGAFDEGMLQPRLRSRGSLPAFASVTLSGPFDRSGAGETPTRRRIFVCRPSSSAEEMPCATKILSVLARRAYRRPVTDEDLQPLLRFYEAGRAVGGFETGIQRALERVLVSPQFLGRIELDPANLAPGTVYRIDDFELASRLSFFLWSSIPDDELLDVASEGKLKDSAVLETQVRRMLADPRSRALVTNFVSQWLYLRDLADKRPDPALFQEFDESLRQAMQRETELFVDSIIREDRSVLDLLRADHTFVNERLAKHYGIPSVYGSHFRRITHRDGGRRGLLGQGSILTLTSYSTRTSPVLRGKWILENILAAPPPTPPPNVPSLESNSKGKALSMRQAMVQHRANPACASCHAAMDPLGFAMENFDAVGRWRTHNESDAEPLDVSATLPDGAKFEGVNGLRELLLSRSDQVVHAVAEKLFTYALSRQLEHYDAPVLRKITREAALSDYRFSSLVLGIVESIQFQMRRSES